MFIVQHPVYTKALQRGREIRNRLIQLFLKETELEQEHYGRALRLPNTSHPDVVRIHAHTLYRASGVELFCEMHPFFKISVHPQVAVFILCQPVGDESQARVVELVGQKPGD